MNESSAVETLGLQLFDKAILRLNSKLIVGLKKRTFSSSTVILSRLVCFPFLIHSAITCFKKWTGFAVSSLFTVLRSSTGEEPTAFPIS